MIALIGNQNSGKTTLFNLLTGSHQKTGNWPGVTLERKIGKIKKNNLEIIDLPGIYSLSSYSEEEMVSRDYLLNESPDLLINIITDFVIKNDIKLYGKDILNQFYSEFCIWDRNNDGKMGIVLTPDDIVDLMVTKSFDYYYQFNKEPNPKVIDFCTGTGSFLIKCSKFTNSLYGCDCGDERYSLCK